jgi:DNA-binding transcriptional LysR family regulator
MFACSEEMSVRTTETTGLRYFCEVALTGSVLRAGANLFVAPSAVSRQIRLLEDDLGCALFVRSARGMTLTPAGHQVLAFAVDARQRHADLLSDLDAARHAVRGQVVLASVEGPAARFVPRALEALALSHPDIRVDIRVAGSQDVAVAVAEGSAQLGFVFGPPTRSDIVALKALPLPLSLMVRPDHALAASTSCSLRDVQPHPVALPTPDFGIRQEVDRACADSGVRLTINYETNSLVLLREIAVRAGVAIFMAIEDTADDLSHGTLVPIPLTDRRLTGTRVTLVQGLSTVASPAARVVSDALLDAMSG